MLARLMLRHTHTYTHPLTSAYIRRYADKCAVAYARIRTRIYSPPAHGAAVPQVENEVAVDGGASHMGAPCDHAYPPDCLSKPGSASERAKGWGAVWAKSSHSAQICVYIYIYIYIYICIYVYIYIYI